jgi:hypothetical protein
MTAAAAVAGCSSLGGSAGDSSASATAPAASSNASFTSRVKSFFSGSSASLEPAKNAAPSAQIDCPDVQSRQGAATVTVNAPGAETSALTVSYVGSFGQTARECIVRGSEVTIKVGVQGRVVVGPAGAPGRIEMPLRYALVREGLEPKTIWTKLYMVPVDIPQGQLNLPFIHIEEDMTVPIPPKVELDNYIIYIGFDPEGVPAPKPAAKPRARAKS